MEKVRLKEKKKQKPLAFFVIGPPAAGKSYFSKHLAFQLRGFGKVYYIDDNNILYSFCQEIRNRNKCRFVYSRTRKRKELKIIDKSILDEVFVELNKISLEKIKYYDYLIIEFTNPNWERAINAFNQEIIKRSIFIFIKAGLKTVIARNRKRGIKSPKSFVPEDYIKKFFTKKNNLSFKKNLKKLYVIENEKDKKSLIINIKGILLKLRV